MSDFRKAKIVVTAAYKNGEILKQDHAIPARVELINIPGNEKFRELNLRLAVDNSFSEELLEGVCSGHVFLSIEQMLTPADRETKS